MIYSPISVVGTAIFNSGQTAQNLTPAANIPAATQAGDVGVVIAVSNNTAANVYTPPAGWSSISSAVSTLSNLETQVWAKDLVTADAGASVTWTTAAGTRFIVLLAVLRGTQGSGSIIIPSATLVAVTQSTITTPAVTSTVPFSGIFSFWAMRVATVAPAPTISTYPGTETFVNRVSTAYTTSPNYTVEMSRLTTPGVAGAYGSQTATASASLTNSNAYAFAIAPQLFDLPLLGSNRARFRAATW